MTRERMQAMTQGRDGISLAPEEAAKRSRVALRFSVIAAILAVASLVVSTAGTSFAQGKVTLDTVVVSNYGAAFAGSVSTYVKGSKHDAIPSLQIKGTHTLLGSATGAAGDSVSTLDDDIAVAVPIDLIDLTGFGAPPPGTKGIPPVVGAGTGFVEIFPPGATGNSTAESIIGTRNVAFGVPNFSGVNTPQGVAFESPFDGIHEPGQNIVAIANTLPFVIGPTDFGLCSAFANANCTSAGFACPSDFPSLQSNGLCCPTHTFFTKGKCRAPLGASSALPTAAVSPVAAACCTSGPLSTPPTMGTGHCQMNLCTGAGMPFACCTGPGTGTCPGFTVGTITLFDTNALTTGTPGFNDTVPPFNNNPVGPVCTSTTPLTTVPSTKGRLVTCPPNSASPPSDFVSAHYNATIGGCDTFLAAPVGVAFDDFGFLFVVDEGAGFITVYPPGAVGDQFPIAIIGLAGSPTGGSLVDPVFVAIKSGPIGVSEFPTDTMYVTDAGNNSIVVFAPFTHFNMFTHFFQGTTLATIKGGNTKLKRPEGIAFSVESDALYVVNNAQNTLSMFDDIDSIVASHGGNVRPTLILGSKSNRMDLPVGVALPQFTPTPTPAP